MLSASEASQGSEVDAKPRLLFVCFFGGIDQKMARREEITQILDDIVERLVEGYAPQKVILFGSYARGEAGEDTDIDLLIIKDTEKPPLERWQEVKRLLRDRSRRVSVSSLVYTSEEIAHRLSVKDFFIEEVLEEGIVLYG